MKANLLVLPITAEELAQLGTLAHEVSELRRKVCTALCFGLSEQAAELGAQATVKAAELLALCAALARRGAPPPVAPVLLRVA